MPLYRTPFPHIMNGLNSSSAPKYTFLVFFASVVDGEMWCPDCRRVESTVNEAFDGPDKPKAIILWVGDKATWRDPKNEFRQDWGVTNVPTIIRIREGKEEARLSNDDNIMDADTFKPFIDPDGTKKLKQVPCWFGTYRKLQI